jgi:MarR-like DNA-binding transcriptional regulator SgrR of sgrS sRNA
MVPQEGGVVRVLLPDVEQEPNPELLSSSSQVFLSASVFRGLVRSGPQDTILPGVARSWSAKVASEPTAASAGTSADSPGWARWEFQLDPLARFPNGNQVTAKDIIMSWRQLLLSSQSPYRWLLDPVVGARAFRRGEAAEVEGLKAGDGTLEIHVHRPTPDLLQRLAHPALGIRQLVGTAASSVGAGPFASGVDRRGVEIGGNPYHPRGRPLLDGVEMLEDQGVDPALLLESGQADLAVLLGRSAGQILTSGAHELRMRRLPGWDRSYALVWNWISTSTDDRVGMPLRLRAALDGSAMVRYLFDGRGEPIDSLLPGAAEGVSITPRPLDLAPSEAPSFAGRVSILHEAGDPAAAAIASRVKASWEEMGLRISLQPLRNDQLWYRLASGDYVAAVLLHHPPTSDPVLGLQGTLSLLGEVADPVLEMLDEASRQPDPALRAAAARLAEDTLLQQGALVPLVRVHAWLGTASTLVGVDGGAAGILYLDDAWWLPSWMER